MRLALIYPNVLLGKSYNFITVDIHTSSAMYYASSTM